jgi:hypothetical protein
MTYRRVPQTWLRTSPRVLSWQATAKQRSAVAALTPMQRMCGLTASEYEAFHAAQRTRVHERFDVDRPVSACSDRPVGVALTAQAGACRTTNTPQATSPTGAESNGGMMELSERIKAAARPGAIFPHGRIPSPDMGVQRECTGGGDPDPECVGNRAATQATEIGPVRHRAEGRELAFDRLANHRHDLARGDID